MIKTLVFGPGFFYGIITDMSETKYIYESPDNGDTIYRRPFGTNQRELVKQGPLRQKMLRAQLWRDIMLAAETDPELQHMLEQTEIYYQMKHAKG
jgi:hypothetical protein